MSATASSGSPSATPSPTWSADQAAAIAAVDGYRAASDQIGSDPSAFSKAQMTSLLSKWAGPAVVKANVASYLSLKKRGFRYDTGHSVLSTLASAASDTGYGTEVVVTRCIDQSPARVLDANGEEVSEQELGYQVSQFLLRQYTVQKRDADRAFRVYGLAPTKGECGPA
ncbi:MAG: hypothetical protein QM779_11805 [Propionicimonas sp.]|uniref:hypothetical protein n=1 Tax=Propionicimonas sp. TaxID=1955623 RepID=UPI003D0F9A26